MKSLNNKFNIVAIIPAAGLSRRMNEDKRLLSCGDNFTLIEKTVSNLIGAGFAQIMIVLETGSPCLQLPFFIKNSDIIKFCELSIRPPSMLYSIQQGINVINNKKDIDYYAVIPADCAFLTSGIINEFSSVLFNSRPELFVPLFNGEQGHPRYISSKFVSSLMSLDITNKFSDIFKKYQKEVLYYNSIYPEIVIDVDTPEDYKKYF